jgi:hypothetical protein
MNAPSGESESQSLLHAGSGLQMKAARIQTWKSRENEKMEARGGIEPPIKVLQTYALPLGDRAGCLRQNRIITLGARQNVSKIQMGLIVRSTRPPGG